MLTKVGSIGFGYDAVRLAVEGNVPNPVFSAGAALSITVGGVTTPADTASGGSLDTVIAEINADLGGATAEESDFTALDDSPVGALGGTYFTINGPHGAPTEDYYVWFDHAARPETTTVTLTADTSGSLNGTYFTINSAGPSAGAYYVWYKVTAAESMTIDFTGINGAALPTGVTPGAWFDITTSPTAASANATYRFWFSDGSTTAPAFTTETLVTIPFTGAETDQQISDLVVTAIVTTSAEADFAGASNGGGTTQVVSLTLATVGNATDAVDGSVATGAAFAITDGLTGAADPAPGGTGIQVDLSRDDADVIVAFLTHLAVIGVTDFDASTIPTPTTVLVTNHATGPVTDSTAGTSGFAVTPTQQGLDAAVDPAAANNAIVVSYTPGDVAADVAADVRAAITAQAGAIFSVGGAGAAIEVTNILEGDATDATEGTTGWAAPAITDGGPGAGPIEVQAYKTIDGKLGFRNTAGNEGTAFTLADGGGGILAAAGLSAGTIRSKKEDVANGARDDALAAYAAQRRDPSL